MDDTHNQVTHRPAKMSLEHICHQLRISYEELDVVDQLADVPAKTLWNMLLDNPVKREHAEKVLAALSLHNDAPWTLDNVEVSVLITPKSSFVDAFRQCSMTYRTLIALAANAGIPRSVIHAMSTGKPVNHAHAEKVLVLLSLHTDRVWSLDTIDVPLLAETEKCP